MHLVESLSFYFPLPNVQTTNDETVVTKEILHNLYICVPRIFAHNKNILSSFCIETADAFLCTYNIAPIFYKRLYNARATLNRFALCANFTLLRKGLNNTLGFRRARSGGLGSAHCRKICSLKRHVPFDALYIIHKVEAITVPRARAARIRKKTLSGSISRTQL